MKKLLTLLVLIVTFASCSTQTKQEKPEEKPLKDQVMDVHDEVMPKMGQLMKTKKALMAKAETIAATDAAAAAELISLAEEIDLANEAMMDWMRNFDPNFTGTEEEVKAYLMKKKQGIDKVAESMSSRLEAGKKALE